MTTRVTIFNTAGHNDVLIEVEYQEFGGNWTKNNNTDIVLGSGLNHSEYVYDGRRIIVTEIKK